MTGATPLRGAARRGWRIAEAPRDASRRMVRCRALPAACAAGRCVGRLGGERRGRSGRRVDDVAGAAARGFLIGFRQLGHGFGQRCLGGRYAGLQRADRAGLGQLVGWRGLCGL